MYQFAVLSMLRAKYDSFSGILTVVEIIKLQDTQCIVTNSRPAWTRSSAAYCRWPCFDRRVGL